MIGGMNGSAALIKQLKRFRLAHSFTRRRAAGVVIIAGLAVAGCQYHYRLFATVLPGGGVILHSDQEARPLLPFARPPLCIDRLEVAENDRPIWIIDGGAEAGRSCSLRFPVPYGARPALFDVVHDAEPLQLGHSYTIRAMGFGGGGVGQFVYGAKQ